MKKFTFVRTFSVEAETEDDAWRLLIEGLEDERNDGDDIRDSWATDDLEDEDD
jgi:hypothetical protein